MDDTTVCAGLDVHKDTLTAACVGPAPEAPVVDLGTVSTQQYAFAPAPQGRLLLLQNRHTCHPWQ